ncbi:circumsporozoite protein-like [Oryza sativa Japonica Group]|uniref:Circumsporozoite protein-like n=1 Tax=Oryza sativa subsp. japonica TaxID=39947 RepID=Q5QNG5_ORYSJ|nr:circumsporozoite protein-like [Oryza sativa Japonica Group]BAD73045.1 circumsporozoite protein-like [Oryza sativa Japonica Group]
MVSGRTRLSAARLTVARTWRLRGCHAGRWEVDDDVGWNGRRTAVASGGANHGDTGESEHTGRLHRTRGDEPTARIRRGMLDGGGLRRRQPAAREGGNGNGAMGDRFGRARASTRLRESVASVGLGGATPSEASDERALRSTGGDGGEHTASGSNGRGGASLLRGGYSSYYPSLRGGDGTRRENGGRHYRAGVMGRSDERPTARE